MEEERASNTLQGEYSNNQETVDMMTRVVQAPASNSHVESGFSHSFGDHLRASQNMAYQNFQMQALSHRKWEAVKKHLLTTTLECERLLAAVNFNCSQLELKIGELKGQNKEIKTDGDASRRELYLLLEELQATKHELALSSQRRLEIETKLAQAEVEMAKFQDLGNHPEKWRATYQNTKPYEESLGEEMVGMLIDLYFYNKAKNIPVDFTKSFHPTPVPNFDEDFPRRAEAANKEEYLSD